MLTIVAPTPELGTAKLTRIFSPLLVLFIGLISPTPCTTPFASTGDRVGENDAGGDGGGG